MHSDLGPLHSFLERSALYNIRQFKPVLYALLLVGVTGFALAAQSPGLWVLGAAGILLNMWLVATGRFVPMPRLMANVVTLAATLYSARNMLTSGGAAVMVIGQFLVLLHLIKLWEQRANRDFAQLLILSLLLMVAAAINTASLLFGLLFVSYLFLSLYCCLLFHLKVETDAARAALALPEEKVGPERLRQDQRYLSRSMRRLTGFVSLVSIVLAVLVFLFFPRGSGASMLSPFQFRPSQALTGFSDQVDFQKVAQITQNGEIMAYVRLWKNDQPVAGGQTLLLRGTALEHYTGDDDKSDGRWQWKRQRGRERRGEQGVTLIPAGETLDIVTPSEGRDCWRQAITLRPTGTSTLFALPGAYSFTPLKRTVELKASRARAAVLQTSLPLQQPLEYEVLSTGTMEGPEFARGENLPPSSQINDRIRQYAMRPEVSGADASGAPLSARRPQNQFGPHALDAEIAANIEQHLQTRFSYTLDLTDARKIIEGQDPLVAFLYDLKRGHCEYFAGAMALMCQSLGMQARVVTGFKCDEYNDLGGYYMVRQSHAHAWVEVKTTPAGWKTYDPTSGNEAGHTRVTLWQRMKHLFNYLEFSYGNSVIAYDNQNQENLVNAVETRMTNTIYQGAGVFDRLREWLDSDQFDNMTSHLVVLVVVLILLALVGFIGLFVWEKWRLRRRAARIGLEALPPDEQLRLARQLGFYDDLLQLLARHQIARPRHLTPLEFARSLAFLPATAYETVHRLTQLFYRVRFGKAELDAGQRRRLATTIGRLAGELAPGGGRG